MMARVDVTVFDKRYIIFKIHPGIVHVFKKGGFDDRLFRKQDDDYCQKYKILYRSSHMKILFIRRFRRPAQIKNNVGAKHLL